MNRVLIGMSGGVDSSVAAVLLKEKGYEVVGITFVFVDDFDTNDAVKVCEKLNIEHHIVDYRDEFKKIVIDSFINDYKSGITPNPCVLCNREVKFNFLYQKMDEYNCDYIATGHYAKIINGCLYKSVDVNKDQTYFLASLSNDYLNKLILPLEGVSKDEVRRIATENNLINADKKDSTDICFITNNFKDYMSDKLDNKIGNVVEIESNKIIGTHNGLTKYTIGQRRGLDIGGNSDRLFVVDKDIENNILYVALGDNSKYLYSNSCIISDVNFNVDYKPAQCNAKFRYRASEYPVTLEYLDNNEILVKYNNIKSVTPGQACVFYDGDKCLGGGIIKSICK